MRIILLDISMPSSGVPSNEKSFLIVVLNASITVFPVIKLLSGFIPSLIRFALLFFVGAK